MHKFFSAFQHSSLAIRLVWETSRSLTLVMAISTIVAGIIPAAIASVGGLFVDAVANLLQQSGIDFATFREEILKYVLIELGLVLLLTGSQRLNMVCQSILRALLGNKINVMILEKALTLELAHFEDSEYYDKLIRARREASSRPLSLIVKTFDLLRDSIALATIGVFLLQFSIWAAILLVVSGVPAFIAETKFSGEAFRIQKRRSAERRLQIYLEMVLTREDGAKEVKLFQLGKHFLRRYIEIFNRIYREDRSLVVRRAFWGYTLGLLASIALYFAYGWVGFAAIAGTITIGQMTMYIAQFRLGQNAVTTSLTAINAMYEDNLYLSNLSEYLNHEVPEASGHSVHGPLPENGIRFENVSFFYPGSERPVLDNVSIHIRPGESLAIVGENGSGKTTLIKLLTRLYKPSSGRILLEGLDLEQWDINVLRNKIGVIFQDFNRYQLVVGENIGIGDINESEDQERIGEAAKKGMADSFIKGLPDAYETQLGSWFKDGKELSGGQWQQIGLSRVFMKKSADILVLDEPTAALDAKAEAEIFSHFRDLADDKISIIISHRFSTVRMADHIVVFEKGKVMEEGSHLELIKHKGVYATLFELQAQGYR